MSRGTAAPDTEAEPRVPRIPPLKPEEWNSEAQVIFSALIGVVEGQSSAARQLQSPVLRTLAHHPALAKAFLDFNRHLLGNSTLPVRIRQISILRLAWIRRSDYMWCSHVGVSLHLGLTPSDIEAAKEGASAIRWTEPERAVICAVDELVQRANVPSSMWQTMAAQLDHRQMLDFLFTTGCYDMLAMVFNSLGIETEPELTKLGEQYGLPPSVATP